MNQNQVQGIQQGAARRDLIWHDGFGYQTNRTKRAANGDITRYLICKDRFCSATAIFQADNFSLGRVAHTHERNIQDELKHRFKENLKAAVLAGHDSLRDIYNTVAILDQEAAQYTPYVSVETSMRRWRMQTSQVPPQPPTLVAFGQMLQAGQWVHLAQLNLGRSFYAGTVQANGATAVLFANQEYVQEFAACTELFVDGTFRSTPQEPRVYQIVTLFTIIYGQALPIVHILMQNKTTALYEASFSLLRDVIMPQFRPTFIMADYEMALYNALRSTYMNANIHGCFFHYAQAVFRRARALGIITAIAGDIAARRILRKYYALVLLPEQSIAGALGQLQAEQPLVMVPLGLYVQRQWLDRVGTVHMSVFGQTHRTNNIMEAYHRRLNDIVRVPHPNIFHLLQCLKRIQATAEVEVGQLRLGNVIRRRARVNLRVFHANLHRVWRNLATNTITVTQFMEQASHFMDNVDGIFYNWGAAVPDVDNVAPLQGVQFVAHPVQAVGLPGPLAAPLPVAAAGPLPVAAAAAPLPAPAPLRACVVCMVNPRTHIFMPCGHYVICGDCSQELIRIDDQRCVICRRDFDTVARVHD